MTLVVKGTAPAADAENIKPSSSVVTSSRRISPFVRIRPRSVARTENEFFESGSCVAPSLEYDSTPEVVAAAFKRLSHVATDLLPIAERILQQVMEVFGSSAGYIAAAYGTLQSSPEELHDLAVKYINDLALTATDVEVQMNDSCILSIAHVSRPSPYAPFIVSLQNRHVTTGMIRPICDHEIGTHLLRMMNEASQVWYRKRPRWALRSPTSTEEGLATLNSLLSVMERVDGENSVPVESLLLWSPALRYYAVCKGAELGFVELFNELARFVPDPIRRFRLCMR
eukprot:GHVT01039535.1.p2 GENE.GHVT01039535.1~~GHVT01039535.1.p2  ORF type:complete len:284 (-),score=24.43 GHVT01039535.1:1905-2756(-)